MANRPIFTVQYAPEQQTKFEEAIHRGEIRYAQAVLHSIPMPPKPTGPIGRELDSRYEANENYATVIIEAATALKKLTHEQSLWYRNIAPAKEPPIDFSI